MHVRFVQLADQLANERNEEGSSSSKWIKNNDKTLHSKRTENVHLHSITNFVFEFIVSSVLIWQNPELIARMANEWLSTEFGDEINLCMRTPSGSEKSRIVWNIIMNV